MPTLSLLRHAKSSWDEPRLDDFDRPLSSRGRSDAPRVGAFMKARGLVPDVVLCSAAKRTRETARLVLDALGPAEPKIVADDELYLATPTAMLARVQKLKPKVTHALVVGHNPGLQALALNLVGEGARADIVALATRLPTAALAVIDFDGGGWSDLRPTRGRLRVFTSPKQLS